MAHLIKITTGKGKFEFDLVCSKCLNILYGYDEVICPSCGAKVNMDKEKVMSEKDFDKLYDQKKGN